MDSSSTFNPFLSSGATNSFASSTLGNSNTIPGFNREKRFHEWHKKQGISAPLDYGSFAQQPAPFSSILQTPNAPTAASNYIQKISTLQPTVDAKAEMEDADIHGNSNEPSGVGRKQSLRKTVSSSPPNSPAVTWPRNTFGSRPITRTRNRSSSMTDDTAFQTTEANAPPLLSIYDFLPSDTPPAESQPADVAFTPTQVRVANYSEDRFPDLVRSLRRYYGPILEPYSGLPAGESKFHDPEVIPREKLDAKMLRMAQPLAGADGGPGHWVRITFAYREAAERAVAGSAKKELVIGGRTILMTFWTEDPISDNPLPFSSSQMDIDPPLVSRRGGTAQPPGTPRRLSSGLEEVVAGGERGNVYSVHMPGAKIMVPKPVEFAKNEGWFSSLVGSLAAGPKAAVTGGQNSSEGGGWGIADLYRYFMDDLIGMKRL